MDLMGPNVQKVKAGARRSAGCAIIVLVTFLIPRAKQRVPNACEGLYTDMYTSSISDIYYSVYSLHELLEGGFSGL